MEKITSYEYHAECAAVAKNLVAEALRDCDGDADAARDAIFDGLLHETIDGHQWIIYTAYNLGVYEHSDNSEALIDDMGADCAADILRDRGLSELHAAIAYAAMYADVAALIDDELDAQTGE